MELRLMVFRCVSMLALLAGASGQTLDQGKTSNLEFRFQPEDIQRGMPRAFVFLLLNTTNHEVRVPVPVFKCSSSFTGTISLDFHLSVNGKAARPGVMSACSCDGPYGVPLSGRIKTWKTVPSGYALALRVSQEKTGWAIVQPGEAPIFPSDQEHSVQPGQFESLDGYTNSGTYEFWGAYSPPSITLSDQKALQELGIDFPRSELKTRNPTFVRK